MILRRLVLAVLLLAAPAAYAGDDGPYLFDLLKQPAYLASWKAMLKGEQVPAWVASYAKTFDGPSSPSKTVTVGGQAYMLGWVCKAHDCGDNQLHVLFAPQGKQAWGLLVSGSNQKWLGRPDAGIQAAITGNMDQ
ncbi:Ivy family c-type lysozyme inhibitor [Methyloceanibacter sp.]|uniref:Ivy family c-type lysozyme inhibitor n=1 Tax=Methyloceanibacter sp. TaxID=1965321 RepID=UPI002D238235|nr:Ivy family c-type lysozyme inhibitor [Methyloceanibacter sp.]HZP09520.1 Ivy family c-type lysozyme inhibitor [Methyloceanibacter sp.]